MSGRDHERQVFKISAVSSEHIVRARHFMAGMEGSAVIANSRVPIAASPARLCLAEALISSRQRDLVNKSVQFDLSLTPIGPQSNMTRCARRARRRRVYQIHNASALDRRYWFRIGSRWGAACIGSTATATTLCDGSVFAWRGVGLSCAQQRGSLDSPGTGP